MIRKILDILAGVAFLSWLLFASAVDSESNIPFIILLIDTSYLALYAWLNDWFEEYEDINDGLQETAVSISHANLVHGQVETETQK